MPSPIGRDQKLWEEKISPQVWDQGTPRLAHQAELVIVLRDPTRFPNRKQYGLRKEAQEVLQPLINKFLGCGLLVTTNSSCNTPILLVKKKEGTWRIVQDLQIINEAVVPLHFTVSLGEILPSVKWFLTVLGLKDAFLCIPLAKESQYLFAFEWEAPGGKYQQMTWTVLPQGFRDSPHLFQQALSQDLLDLDLGPNGKILQYVDHPLISSPDEKNTQQHGIQVLFFFFFLAEGI